ncbi:hypothetical protein [Pseudoclavibacter helvolus]|uniref:Uncharacterized protein n=1 Tax=Pseudoclavibacter helvolus TaxID=255205 RepID=A0A7W4UN91_9MICO|nr:hypothetical protein [Pseudoclavibacter helvolus]MBB2957298.1 hypothetical protein [Pseudoclavibacter helvolus]
MTAPLARISAAIEKLEQLQATSTPGPWHIETLANVFVVGRGPTFDGTVSVAMLHETHLQDSPSPADAELIVTLHRTIPFTLMALAQAKHDLEQGRAAAQRALALTDAILGTA